MERQLRVRKVVKISDGRLFCVNCTFNLPTIIRAGYAPDDIIPKVISKTIAAYLLREKLRKAGFIDLDEE